MSANSAMLRCWDGDNDDGADGKSIETKNMRISLSDKTSPICIQIVAIKYLVEFDALLVKLFDGSVHKNSFVDKTMWQRLGIVEPCVRTGPYNAADVMTTKCPSTSIEVGSIVILYEYAFEASASFVGQACMSLFIDCVSNAFDAQMVEKSDETSVMKLLNFAIIGHDPNLECYTAKQRELSQQTPGENSRPVMVSSIQQFTSDSFNIVDTCGWQVAMSSPSHISSNNKKTITIAMLARVPISSEDWTIKAQVFRVGILKTFTNRTTGVTGQLQRILFKDESGLIEAIAYNDAIKILNLANLKRDKSYFVYNAKLGASPHSLQEWFQTFQTSPVEIRLFGSTKIIDTSLVDDDETASTSHYVPRASSSQNHDNYENDSDSVLRDDNDDDPASFLRRQLAKTSHVPDVESISRCYVDSRVAAIKNELLSSTSSKAHVISALVNDNDHPVRTTPLTYTKLKDIKDKFKKNDTVNTMGVLTSLGKCENLYVTTSRSSIKIRRIVIIDESQTTMSVAIWGDEAQNFGIPLESVVLVQDAKVAFFNGASLSIYRKSRLLEYTQIFNNKDAKMLKQWYDTYSGKSKSQTIVA
jgi:hypothetical protein